MEAVALTAAQPVRGQSLFHVDTAEADRQALWGMWTGHVDTDGRWYRRLAAMAVLDRTAAMWQACDATGNHLDECTLRSDLYHHPEMLALHDWQKALHVSKEVPHCVMVKPTPRTKVARQLCFAKQLPVQIRLLALLHQPAF